MEYFNELQAFIDRHYDGGVSVAEPPAPAYEDFAKGLGEPFSVALIQLIRAKGRDEADVYKRAHIDRRHFSKIRSNTDYSPGKRTVLALAAALELTLPETRALLERAGYALSRSVMADVIVEYFIANGRYDIFEINEALEHFGQQPLGGSIL